MHKNYVDRLRQYEQLITALFRVGARGGEQEKYRTIRFSRQAAEIALLDECLAAGQPIPALDLARRARAGRSQAVIPVVRRGAPKSAQTVSRSTGRVLQRRSPNRHSVTTAGSSPSGSSVTTLPAVGF